LLFYRDLKPIFDDGLSGHLDFMALLLAHLRSAERLISGMPSLGFTVPSSASWGNISWVRQVDREFVKLSPPDLHQLEFSNIP
jgi:hypothetical protein